MLLKDTARLEQERAAFASKRQVYKGFSREQLSSGVAPRTHSADSMESFTGGTSSYSRQQVPLLAPWLFWQLPYVMRNKHASKQQATHRQRTSQQVQCTTDLLLLMEFKG